MITILFINWKNFTFLSDYTLTHYISQEKQPTHLKFQPHEIFNYFTRLENLERNRENKENKNFCIGFA